MKSYKTIKRVLDILLSFLMLQVLSPIILAAAAAVWIESGRPALFKQQRLGLKGKPFTLFKLRTMVENAEQTGTGAFTYQGDPRVTRVGRLLRKTSLDELPQLFNVLRGDMSLIGPRPTLTYHPYRLDEYPEEFRMRFEVLPGITGLAQISGRKKLLWKERLVLDREYVEQFGFRQDVKIFFTTILKILTMDGCYNTPEAFHNSSVEHKCEGRTEGSENAAIQRFTKGTAESRTEGSENAAIQKFTKGAAKVLADGSQNP